MRLYLDDDSVDPGLIRPLRRDGHDVEVPADAGLSGCSDQSHLAHAIRDRRAVLTRNYGDFQDLHDLVFLAAQGHHQGKQVEDRGMTEEQLEGFFEEVREEVWREKHGRST